MRLERLSKHADRPSVRVPTLRPHRIRDLAFQECRKTRGPAERYGQFGRQMRLDLVRGGEAHQQAIVHGVRMWDGLERLLEFLVLSVVLIEGDFLRKADDRHDAGEQRFSPRSTTTSDRTDACRHRSNSAERSVTARGTPAFVSGSTSSASFAPQPVVKSTALSRWIWIGKSLKAMSSIRTGMMKFRILEGLLDRVGHGNFVLDPAAVRIATGLRTTKTTLSVRFRNASSMLFQNGVPPARSKMSAQTLYPKPVSLVPSQRTNSLSFGVAG